MKAEFITKLEGEWQDDDEYFKLSKDLIYNSELLDKQIIAPAGFLTDFASVPRFPIIYSIFGDRAHHESVIHDWLYYSAICDKSSADRVFLECMKVRGKSIGVRQGMYLGVKFGAFKAWSEHRKAGHPKPDLSI